MVTLVVVSIPIAFLNEVNSIAALTLVHGADFLSMFDNSQRDALAMLFLNLHFQGLVVDEIFFGLCAFAARAAGVRVAICDDSSASGSPSTACPG